MLVKDIYDDDINKHEPVDPGYDDDDFFACADLSLCAVGLTGTDAG